MAAVSPAPNSSPSPDSPSAPSQPPPVASTPPPSPLQPPSPPPQQSPPPNPFAPSPSSPPPSRQPSATSPPPDSETPPPLSPPPEAPPQIPPPSSPEPPPVSSPPPTPSNPPPNSPPQTPPPQSSNPPPPPIPSNAPPPSSLDPPPPSATPPVNSNPQIPPPQPSNPPQNAPPPPPLPPNVNPPANPTPPPPPPPTNPPENPPSSPPSPVAIPPRNSPPPQRLTPPPSPIPKPSLPPPPPLILPPPSKTPALSPGNSTDEGSVPKGGSNSNSNSNVRINTGGVIAIGVVAGIVVLSIIGFVVWCITKPRKKDSVHGAYIMPSSSPNSEPSLMKVHSTLHQDKHASGETFSPKEFGGLGNSRSLFTYEELFKATNAFSPQNLLGEGGFGSVYKGYLPDGREVAVKELKIGGGQGEQEFKAEVEIIGRIHHRHLVSLVGYCILEHQRFLVYDYVPNNSLYYHLHVKGNNQRVLDWGTRIKIAAGAARGIAYLHEDCHPRIIHRDIKSSNILLDENFEARVSDFGLAKLALDAQTHITTRVVGTFGYVAPEYASSGKLTERSDVYSFGVVLLELITGRKAVDASRPMGDESLVEWARPLLNHALDRQDFERLVDPRLERNYIESEMLKMIGIAAACVRYASAKRPQMGQVVRAFDSLVATDLSNGMRFGESRAFDSGQKSSELRFIQMLAFGNQDYSSGFYSQGCSNA